MTGGPEIERALHLVRDEGSLLKVTQCPELGTHLIEHSLHPLILVVGQPLSLVARHEKLLSM